MDTFQKYKKVFLFAGILAVVVILYEVFFSGGGTAAKESLFSPTSGGLISESALSNPSDAIVGSKLLSVLSELKNISLDASLFSDPVFESLKDWSSAIEPQPFAKTLGRRNPFSDFGRVSGGAAGSANLPGAAGSGGGAIQR